MKRATLEATDENILQSIKEQEQNGTRNTEIKDFIEALELIEGNMFISLDARWGEGKTFYVRQIEKTLEYQTMKNFSTDDTQDELDKMKLYFTGTTLEEIDLKHSYLPVYYNAWLYDNHGDPLMSLLYVIVKKCGIWIDSKLTKDKTEKLKDLIKSVQVSLGMFSIGGDKVIDSFIEKDIFKDIQLAEDIRQKVKEIFNEIIEEQTQKLVIFIDELDRCKPSYALEMLERIKHYFDDDRIIFIVSVNKEQLTHTISNYYGNGFDSTGYLNKFFDIDMYLPRPERAESEINSDRNDQYWLVAIANELRRYYKLSLRDSLIYNQKISQLSKDNLIQDQYHNGTYSGMYLSLFLPIVVVLNMVDIEEKRKFINGESKIFDTLKNLPAFTAYFRRFRDNGFEQINAIYQYSFGEGDEKLLNKMNLSAIDVAYLRQMVQLILLVQLMQQEQLMYQQIRIGKGIYEKSYIKWKDMMQRCHDKEVHKKYKPEYADKCVCEEWQNYANFKLWYDEHHVFGNRIDLDKDILKPGNKEYSPETCVLIEHYINTIFERHAQDNIYENEDGKYFVGSNRKKVYETYDEVFEFACNKKKERIEKVAEKNLGRIPKCAYDAMLRYDVEALIRRDVIAA